MCAAQQGVQPAIHTGQHARVSKAADQVDKARASDGLCWSLDKFEAESFGRSWTNLSDKLPFPPPNHQGQTTLNPSGREKFCMHRRKLSMVKD